ncbi:MAG: DUF2797 domain-containing protein [Zoogloea sp.]|jgi:hypothetical protein|nr:MAG: DUF2797 domain-containing protein [Zoogloea sp.]
MNDGSPLRKMLAGIVSGTVAYALPMAEGPLELAPYIGHRFTLRATGALSCINCGRRVKKLFGQGFCYPCLQSAPEAAECIIRPELCQAHLGGGRDPEWERAHHATEHVVYLSHTGGIKVGVTRSTQVPVRWIDQGAVGALIIARVPYRQLAGLIEVDLKRIFADRTNWRAMLKLVPPHHQALMEARERARVHLREELQPYLLPDEVPLDLVYPVLAYPPKITSVSLEKTPEVSGRLLGAKGQYLIFEDGRVLNIRNHSGFHVAVEDSEAVV